MGFDLQKIRSLSCTNQGVSMTTKSVILGLSTVLTLSTALSANASSGQYYNEVLTAMMTKTGLQSTDIGDVYGHMCGELSSYRLFYDTKRGVHYVTTMDRLDS